MTRDFSQEQRDNRRPYSRNTPSDGYNRDQGSFDKPARPRLSRDAVDRAWENGATRRYADYRPRQNSQTPSGQRPGRPSSDFNRSRQPQNRGPYNARPDHFRSSSPSFNQGYQPRSEEASETGPRRFQEPGQHPPARQGYDEHRNRNQRDSLPEAEGHRGSYRDDRPPRPYQRGYGAPQRTNYRQNDGPRDFERNDRPPRPYQGGYNAPQRTNYRQDDGPRNFERGARPPRPYQRGYNAPQRTNYRQSDGPRDFERNDRSPRPYQGGRRPGRDDSTPGRDAYNPRWQSRPAVQRDSAPSQYERPRPEQERFNQRPAQFEGDYERFDAQTDETQAGQNVEPHVTRLPDGRVLRGSRPSQRKQAHFWNEVSEETESLLANQAETPPAEAQPEQVLRLVTPKPEPLKPARPARKRPEGKTRVVKTVKTGRARDAGAQASRVRPKKKKAPGAQRPVTRPSQRGFKWPAPEE